MNFHPINPSNNQIKAKFGQNMIPHETNVKPT